MIFIFLAKVSCPASSIQWMFQHSSSNPGRQPANLQARQGRVLYHYDMDDIDMSEGEWLILARTNFFANKVSQHMKSMGVLFWREGSGWSVSSRVLIRSGAIICAAISIIFVLILCIIITIIIVIIITIMAPVARTRWTHISHAPDLVQHTRNLDQNQQPCGHHHHLPPPHHHPRHHYNT